MNTVEKLGTLLDQGKLDEAGQLVSDIISTLDITTDSGDQDQNYIQKYAKYTRGLKYIHLSQSQMDDLVAMARHQRRVNAALIQELAEKYK